MGLVILWCSSLWQQWTSKQCSVIKDISILVEEIYLSIDKDNDCIVNSFIVLTASRKIFVNPWDQGLRGFKRASYRVIGVPWSKCCDFITTSGRWHTVIIWSHVTNIVNIVYKYLYSIQVTKSWNIKSAIKYIPQYPPCMNFNVTPNDGTQESPVPTQMQIYEKTFYLFLSP